MRYPHWVNYVRMQLESMYDPQTIYQSGFTVHTTLDPVLQDEAERLVHDQVVSLSELNVTDGALVAIRPATGEILAMVGSADFYDEQHAGQVNMAIQPRQPGIVDQADDLHGRVREGLDAVDADLGRAVGVPAFRRSERHA